MSLLAIVFCLLPLLIGGALLLALPTATRDNAPRLAQGLAALSFAGALVYFAALLVAGAADIAVAVAWFRLDAVGAVFVLVIGFVGLAIVRFSGGYLSGEARRPQFLGLLLLTLLFAQVLALSADVVLFGLAWIGMSLPVQKLLTYYDRPGARIAARLKFSFARASDVAVLAALGLLAAAAGSTQISVIATAVDTATPIVVTASVLLAIAILLRSAQVPTHAWLLRAVEAPTPVSAVLHAGVVNAGGLIALRFAPVLAQSTVAMTLLALVSGVSVLIALGAMSGEQRLKTRLAWSTVAQMGFMLLQCSLGLWGLALLHIAAHALYKSFAFLNAGTIRPTEPATKQRRSGVLATILAFAAVIAASLPIVRLDAASLLIGAVFVLGLGAFGAGARSTSAMFVRVSGAAVATLLWLCLHELANVLVPATPAQASALLAVAVLIAGAVLALLAVQTPLRDRPAIRALRLHVRNGLYIDLVVERLAQGPMPAALPEFAK